MDEKKYLHTCNDRYALLLELLGAVGRRRVGGVAPGHGPQRGRLLPLHRRAPPQALGRRRVGDATGAAGRWRERRRSAATEAEVSLLGSGLSGEEALEALEEEEQGG